MKAKQLKKLSKDKLIEKLEESKKAVSDLRFSIKIGETKDYGEVKKKRKDIARINTILNEGVETPVVEVKKAPKAVKTKKKTEEKKKKVKADSKKEVKKAPKATKEDK